MSGTFGLLSRVVLVTACALGAAEIASAQSNVGRVNRLRTAPERSTGQPALPRAVPASATVHSPAVNSPGDVVPASMMLGSEPTISWEEGSWDDGGCADGGCEPGTIMGHPAPIGICCGLQLWGHFEYLLWWEKEDQLPALATTSTPGTARDNAGVLGFPTTSILFGDGAVEDAGALSGGRLTLGLWLGQNQTTGVFGRGFAIEDHGQEFQDVSTGSPILARPFFNAFTLENDALLLGFPNQISGDVQITTSTQTQGAQALLRRLWRVGGNYRMDYVAGYRYLEVENSLRVDNSLRFIDPAAASFGTNISQFDQFEIDNVFHGGEIGLMGHSVDGRWVLDFLATVAFGSMQKTSTITGSTVTNPAVGGSVTEVGGLLTQKSNLGVFQDDTFTIIPEATVTLGYFVTPRMDLSVGYSFLFVNHVARAGDIVDTSINLTQRTGPIQGEVAPVVRQNDSEYWLQGINFGLNFRY